MKRTPCLQDPESYRGEGDSVNGMTGRRETLEYYSLIMSPVDPYRKQTLKFSDHRANTVHREFQKVARGHGKFNI